MNIIMQLFVWSAIIYGVTQIVVQSTLFTPLRAYLQTSRFSFLRLLYKLITCFLCTSVWVGFIMSLLLYSPTQELWSPNIILGTFFDGMLASCIIWFMYNIEHYISK